MYTTKNLQNGKNYSPTYAYAETTLSADLCALTHNSHSTRTQQVNSKILFIRVCNSPGNWDLHNKTGKGQEANGMASVRFDAQSAMLGDGESVYTRQFTGLTSV